MRKNCWFIIFVAIVSVLGSCDLKDGGKAEDNDSSSIWTWRLRRLSGKKVFTDGQSEDVVSFHACNRFSCFIHLTHVKGEYDYTCPCYFDINKEGNNPATITFIGYELYYECRLRDLKFFKDKTTGLDDCIEITNMGSLDLKDITKLRSVIWSKSKGLVSYEIQEYDGTIKRYRRK